MNGPIFCFVPSAGEHRVDRVVIDAITGVATRIAGTAVTGSPSATPPAIPPGKRPCAQVRITSADTVITDDMITDERTANVSQPPPSALTKAIHGFTYEPTPGSPNDANGINIAAGGAMDSTGAYWIEGAALRKLSNTAWAVGNNAGMLDTGAVGDSDYYLWAIARSDTGVVDYLSSLSSTAPTMPANYDYKRLIGWFKRVGGITVAFHTYEREGGGLDFAWDSPTLDINLSATLTTLRRTDAVKVPLNFSTEALLTVYMQDAGAAFIAWVGDPNTTDAAPSASAAPLHNFTAGAGLTVPAGSADMQVRTSATGTIAARASIATVDLYVVVTRGFKWARR